MNKDFSECFSLFADCPSEVGEGPLWNGREQMLYWLDVSRGEVFRKHYKSDPSDYSRFKLDIGKIGGAVFTEDDSLLLFAAEGRVWKWKAGSEPKLKAELREASKTRFNDVIADPAGRVYCGVAPEQTGGKGSMWRMNADFSFNCIEEVTQGMPNGMGFSPDMQFFYFTVTNERIIYRYRYEIETGSIGDRKALVKVPDSEGFPDGMTVDAEGCIWSGQWNGSRLVRYSPEGKKIQEIRFPVAKVSCVSFGGPEFTDIFASTANHPWSEEEYNKTKAGSVYIMKQGVRGLAEFRI